MMGRHRQATAVQFCVATKTWADTNLDANKMEGLGQNWGK